MKLFNYIEWFFENSKKNEKMLLLKAYIIIIFLILFAGFIFFTFENFIFVY